MGSPSCPLYGARLRMQGSEVEVQDIGFRVLGGAQGRRPIYRVQGLGFRIQGFEFRVRA